MCWPVLDLTVLTVTSPSVLTMCLIVQVAEKTYKVFQFSTVHSHNCRQRNRGSSLLHCARTWSLCSLCCPEIYTIQGNSHGRPCYLPFLYDGQWFHNCTNIGREDGHLWCATTYDYGKDERWGFCPVKSEFSLCIIRTVFLDVSDQLQHNFPTVISSCLQPWRNRLHISFPHCQVAAVRHSGILTRWRTAVTSLTSRLRCHGRRLGSVASSRGQTC